MSVTPMAVNRPMSIDAVNRALTGDRLLVLSLSFFSVADIAAAAATSFGALLGARLLLALAAGTFMPAASAYGALSVEPAKRGRALALVYAGMTLATVK